MIGVGKQKLGEGKVIVLTDEKGSMNLSASVISTVALYVSVALSLLLATIGILSRYSLVAQLGIVSVCGFLLFWLFLLSSIKKEIGKISAMIFFALATVCFVVAALFLVDGFWVVILSIQPH